MLENLTYILFQENQRVNFFKRALGCDPKVDNNRSIQHISMAFDDFSKKIKINSVDKVKVNKAIEAFLKEKAKDPIDKKSFN